MSAWAFFAEVVRVVDGDTVKLKADVGFRMTFTDNFRLARIDAPEVRGKSAKKGKEAKEWLIKFLEDNGNKCIIRTIKHGKYRWVCDMYVGDSVSVSDELVKAGHAKFKDF